MRFLKILRNRYMIASLIFVTYLMFVDQFNFRAQYKLTSELIHLEEERDFYKSELRKDSITYHTLFNNKENIEKFARERFMMKKPNEDIYLIVREED